MSRIPAKIHPTIPDGIDPIQEELSSGSLFARVMPFLDRYEVLEDILHYRKLLKLDTTILYDEYQQWFNQASDDSINKDYAQLVWKIALPICRDLMIKYKRPDLHYFILWKSIICGKITDADCGDTYIEIIHDPSTNYPRLALIFTPKTTLKEVQKVFAKRDKFIKKYSKYLLVKSEPYDPTKFGRSSLKKIKAMRKVYWRYKPNQYSSHRLAAEIGGEPKSIKSGIKSYADRIKKAIM